MLLPLLRYVVPGTVSGAVCTPYVVRPCGFCTGDRWFPIPSGLGVQIHLGDQIPQRALLSDQILQNPWCRIRSQKVRWLDDHALMLDDQIRS